MDIDLSLSVFLAEETLSFYRVSENFFVGEGRKVRRS